MTERGKYQGVIDLMAEREKRKKGEHEPPDRGRWMLMLNVYAPATADDKHSGWIESYDPDDNLTPGERLRGFAAALDELSLMLRDQAEQIEQSDDGHVLSRVTVFESSRVRAWTSDKINSPEHATWMARRFDEAKDLTTEHALSVQQEPTP